VGRIIEACRSKAVGLRGVLVKCGLLAGGIVVAAGLGEILARTLEQPSGDLYEARGWPTGPRDRYRLTHDELGWEPVPNSGEPGGQFSNNGLGFRDLPAQRKKPQDTRRILVLGDSVAYGPGLNLDETFDNQLERLLTERLHQPVEALNMAVPGYNSVQQALLLERRGLDLGADLVLVAWTTNDDEFTPAIVVSGDEVLRRMPQDQKMPIFLSLPPRAQVWLLKNSALYRLISRRGAVLAASCAGEEEVETLKLATSENRLALWRIAEMAREMDAGVLYVLWPEFCGDPEAEALRSRTVAFLGESGLPLLDLSSIMSRHDAEQLMRYPPHDCMHPSVLACRLAAEAVAGHISRTGFVAPPATDAARRLPTERKPTEAAEPEAPRYYVPAPDLGADSQAFSRMQERYADPPGDASEQGPDLAGFSAGRCGDDLCFRLRVARPVAVGDRLVINLIGGGVIGHFTLRPKQIRGVYAAVGMMNGPETYLQTEPRETELVHEARVARAELPPPLNRVRHLQAGDVMAISVDEPDELADEHHLVFDFYFEDKPPGDERQPAEESDGTGEP